MIEWWLMCLFGLLLIIAVVTALYPVRQQRKAALMLALLCVIVVTSAYWHWGSWPLWQDYLEKQARQKQIEEVLKTIHSPAELIDKLQARLDETPNSTKGWFLLAKLYASQDQWQQAKAAVAKARRWQPNETVFKLFYVQCLFQLNHRQFNEEIRTLVQEILNKNKNQPDALAMMAMDSFANQRYLQAIQYWQTLLGLLPNESEDAKFIRKAIAKAQMAIKNE